MSNVETEFDPFADEEVTETDAATAVADADDDDDGSYDSVKGLLAAVESHPDNETGKVPQNAQVTNWTDNNDAFPVTFEDDGSVTYTAESVEWIVAKMQQSRGNKEARNARKVQSLKAKITRTEGRIAAMKAELAELTA